MIVRSSEKKLEEKHNFKGGKGSFTISYFLRDEDRKSGAIKLMEVTLPPGSSIGYHQHTDDEEIYYIVRGKGTVNDNGTRTDVFAGDVIVTRKGEFHGMENNSGDDLVFFAIINAVQ